MKIPLYKAWYTLNECYPLLSYDHGVSEVAITHFFDDFTSVCSLMRIIGHS